MRTSEAPLRVNRVSQMSFLHVKRRDSGYTTQAMLKTELPVRGRRGRPREDSWM